MYVGHTASSRRRGLCDTENWHDGGAWHYHVLAEKGVASRRRHIVPTRQVVSMRLIEFLHILLEHHRHGPNDRWWRTSLGSKGAAKLVQEQNFGGRQRGGGDEKSSTMPQPMSSIFQQRGQMQDNIQTHAKEFELELDMTNMPNSLPHDTGSRFRDRS